MKSLRILSKPLTLKFSSVLRLLTASYFIFFAAIATASGAKIFVTQLILIGTLLLKS